MILKRIFSNKVTQKCSFSIHSLVATTDGGTLISKGQTSGLAQLEQKFSTKPDSYWQSKCRYPWFLPVQTRWKDNDQYLHVNNSVYHAMFDSVINVYLIRNLGLDITSTKTQRGYMVTNSCTFYGSAVYPEVYMAGLSVAKIGNSSVTYKLGLFPLVNSDDSLFVDVIKGHQCTDPVMDMVQDKALVVGGYVHVFVDPITEKSAPISDAWRNGLSKLMIAE